MVGQEVENDSSGAFLIYTTLTTFLMILNKNDDWLVCIANHGIVRSSCQVGTLWKPLAKLRCWWRFNGFTILNSYSLLLSFRPIHSNTHIFFGFAQTLMCNLTLIRIEPIRISWNGCENFANWHHFHHLEGFYINHFANEIFAARKLCNKNSFVLELKSFFSKKMSWTEWDQFR